ncbi:MAG: efflux RND transporter permease subunit, partial [Wolinella sp.]
EAIEDNFVERYITPILSFDWDDSAKIRPLKSFEIEKMLQEHLQGFKKAYALEELRVAAPKAGIVKHDIEISLIGPESLLKQALPHLTQTIEQTHGVKSVYNDMKAGISEIKLAINPYGESLGLNEGILSALLSDYFLFAKKGKSLDEEGVVHLRIEDIYKDELSTLRYFSLQLGSQKVLLEEVVDFHTQEAPEKIIKEDGDRQRTVYADVIPEKLTAIELLKKLEPELKSLKESGLTLKLGGEREKNEQFIHDMIVASVLALFLIFLTLLLMFDSFLVSLMILSVIPLSFMGVILGHSLLGLNLSMPYFVGILGLAGVVFNDGIVMVDFIRKAKNDEDFFKRAAKRLRPILLTSITTFIGLATLIFFPSGQAKTLQPLATSLGFGLLWGTILNLYYLPLLFAFLSQFKRPKLRLKLRLLFDNMASRIRLPSLNKKPL